MDNVLRAKREVRRLINANVSRHAKDKNTDKFLTLTFAENVTDIQQANRHFHNFIKKLHYRFGTFEYVGVPAIQWKRYKKYGVKVWHYHIALFGFAYVPQEKLLKMWDRGTVSIEAMEDQENPGSYMARYMGKDFGEEELRGHRRYFTSQGLYRSEESRWESVGEILKRLDISGECKTFEITYINNPFVGAVTYGHYDLRRNRRP